MNNIEWGNIVNTLGKNKQTVIPVAVFTTLGGLLFICRKKIFGGQQPLSPSQSSPRRTQNEILNLPPETRKCIWEKLCYKDILILRLVCEEIKNDVDTLVGLYGHLNNADEQRFSFFRNVTLKKCHISDLVKFSDRNVFASPYHLEYLSICERSTISLETLHNILWDCNNVKQLFMRFNHLPEGSRVTSDLSRIVLNSLQTKSRLKEFQFLKTPSHNRTAKSIPRDISHLSFPVSRNLTYVDIEIPDVLPGHLAEWKYFLEQQSHLITLIADFGGISWKFFSKIISKNQETLKGVYLYHLRHIDESSNDESPFDWAIFRKCSKLQMLQISGFSWVPEPMPSINFSVVPGDNLLELCIRRVILGRVDIARIYHEMPHLRSGSFERIGTEGDTAALELMMASHQLEMDRDIQDWEHTQRNIEIISDVLFYSCAVIVITAYVAIFYRFYHMDDNLDQYMK